MSALQTLRRLIRVSSPEEQNSIRVYLQAFDSRGKKFDNKSLRLFDVLCGDANGEIRDAEIEQVVYGKKKSPAFYRLALRLRDKMLEALCSSVNINRPSAYAERVAVSLSLRRRLLEARILAQRHEYDLAESLLTPFISSTAQHELFTERLMLLEHLNEIAALRNDKNMMQRIPELESDCRSRLSLIAASKNLLQLAETGQHEKAAQHLKELEPVVKDFGSAMTSYYLFGVRASIALHSSDQKQAASYYRKKLNLALRNDAVKSEPRIARSSLELALQLIALKRFQTALATIRQALTQTVFYPGDDEKFRVAELQALFHAGKIHDIPELVDRYYPEHRDERLLYLKAVALFEKLDFDKAQNVLSKIRWRKLDEAGFGNWARLLARMNLIELGLEKSDRKLPKKLLQLHREIPLQEPITGRERTALKIMQTLIRQNVDFKITYQHCREEIELLQSKLPYSFLSAEMIRFEDWFVGKVTKH